MATDKASIYSVMENKIKTFVELYDHTYIKIYKKYTKKILKCYFASHIINSIICYNLLKI